MTDEPGLNPSSVQESTTTSPRREGPIALDSHSSDEPAWLTVAARAAIPLGYAVVVAVFVALGIQGDVLARLIRNDPRGVGWAFIVAVIAVVVPLVAVLTTGTSMSERSRRLRVGADVLGAALLVAATSIAVISGVNSFSEREQPAIALTSGTSNANGTAGLTFSSSAASQKAYQRLLLRIEAFPGGTSAQNAWTACRDTTPPVPEDDDLHLVYWGEVGPSSTGAVTTSVSIEVSTTDYQYVCAHAALSNPVSSTSAPKPAEARYSSLLIDARQLPHQAATTEEKSG